MYSRGTRWSGCVLSVVYAGCYVAHDDAPHKPVASDTQDLVGGFSANDPALNAIGSMVLYDPYWDEEQQLCTAVLVKDNMAITAKHCVEVFDESFSSGTRIFLALGPNAYSPIKEVEIVDYEKGPVNYGGYVDRGHDFGVLHLGQRITDIAPLPWAKLTDTAVGLKFTGIGYGEQDNNGTHGTRKMGTLTLRARKGKTLKILAGSFEQYFEAVEGEPLPESCGYSDDDAGISGPPVIDAGLFPFPRGGTGGGPSVDPLCYYAERLREFYDTQFLEAMTEVVVGGAPGDSQPCYGDSGGPLLRKRNDGQLTIWAITSGIVGVYNRRCHPYGAVYAALDTTVTDFLDQAKEWVDPCEDLSSAGRCTGTVAERCTTLAEGKRRKLAFDCASVDLTCERQTDGTIGCGSQPEYFAPPKVVAEKPITRETIARKMLGPASHLHD